MSKLTKLVRGGFTEDCDYTGDPSLVQDLCMEHERLEAEVERLEGLLRAWATLEEEWKGNNERYRGTDLIKAKDAVYAEGLKLIGERT